MKSFEAELSLVADPLAELGEGRRREGRNGHVHLSDHRGTGPSIQGRIRRDNVGKGHRPAGAGSDLQRPAKRGMTEGGGRELVWRMSPYELRKRRNVLRRGAGRHACSGNARGRQRGSGHLAVPGGPPDVEPGMVAPRSGNESGSKPTRGGVYVGQHLSLTRVGKAPGGKSRSEPDSGNPTVRDRRGALRNVTHGEPRNPPRNRKSGSGHSSPTGARAQFLSRPGEAASV